MKNIIIPIFFLIISFFTVSCKKDDPLIEPTDKNSGCKIEFIKQYPEFSDKLSTLLRASKDLNYEIGYIIYPAKGGVRYQQIEGSADAASIILTPQEQMIGLMHSHYNNLYPNFSGSDIRSIIDAYYAEKINDYQTFFITVVSSLETSYLLKISDLNKFINFSNLNLIEKNSFLDFESRYHNLQQSQEHNLGLKLSFEMALLHLLKDSGLSLYKSDYPFKYWNILHLNTDNKVQQTSCL